MPFRGDNPFEEIEQLFDRMSQELGEGTLAGVAGSILVDVEDRTDAFVVTADVPGFSKDEIDVTLSDRTLRIAADRETEAEETEADFIRRERHRESASRTVRLPEAVDEEGISATYEHGVLTVTLPKIGGDGGHRIEVE